MVRGGPPLSHLRKQGWLSRQVWHARSRDSRALLDVNARVAVVVSSPLQSSTSRASGSLQRPLTDRLNDASAHRRNRVGQDAELSGPSHPGNDHRTRGCARVVPVRPCARRADTIKGAGTSRETSSRRGMEAPRNAMDPDRSHPSVSARISRTQSRFYSTLRSAVALRFCRIHTELRLTRERNESPI